jgi:hypothetical protein
MSWYEWCRNVKVCLSCGRELRSSWSRELLTAVHAASGLQPREPTKIRQQSLIMDMDRSVHDGTLQKYEEQFERVKRWYERFKRIDEGTSHEKNTEYYHDEVYAFFLNCYHLKDWIKNDDTVPRTVTTTVESFVGQSTNLSICADICNSIKHLNLFRPPRSGKAPQWGRRHFKAVIGEGSTMAVEYSIITASGAIDAFDLATKCVEEWEQFIKSNIP